MKGMFSHPRTPREFGRKLLKVAFLGIVLVSATTIFANLLFTRPLEPFLNGFWPSMYVSAIAGTIFSLSFYMTCGFPWVFLGPLIGTFPPSVRRPTVALVGAIGACAGITIASFFANRALGMEVIPSHQMGQIFAIEAVCGAIIALVIGAFKKLSFDVQAAEARAHEREIKEAALSEAAAKAQAAALQAQINPHFFFNTLNTLSALIPADPEAAQEIVGRLADMFRYTLACSRAESVTLEQELAFTENYLRLEQARFSSRLRVTLPRGDFGDIRLPGLSLQPLVENAIRYGVAKLVEGGGVKVAVRRNGTQCSVDVSSPSTGPTDPSRFFREGHALANVRDRLKLYAGEHAGVDVTTENPGRVCVSLVLPK